MAQEGCISCKLEKRNEKVWNLHSIVATLNLDQDVAKKGGEISIAGHNVAKSVEMIMSRYGSLISNPSTSYKSREETSPKNESNLKCVWAQKTSISEKKDPLGFIQKLVSIPLEKVEKMIV